MDKSENFCDEMDKLGQEFASRAAKHDEEDSFVSENFAVLKERKVFSAVVPKDLGGAGVSHSTMCRALRTLARHDSSTALALSMHQHPLLFQVYNHQHGKPGKVLLEKVLAQELMLVTSGGNDWLNSNGKAEKVAGGFRVSARKPFSSGSPAGNLFLTTAPYRDPVDGWQVLHFPVPMNSEGVSRLNDWKTMGMRGTGSNTLVLENVFVPDAAIGLRRPRGPFHPAFHVICVIALPIVMSVYVGIAEKAAALAREQARKRKDDAGIPFLLGELENRLTAAQLALDSAIALANDLDFEPTLDRANAIVVRKTLIVEAALQTGAKALEIFGGAGFYRAAGLEKLLRDLQAAQFHPWQEKRQHLFTGRIALGLDPVEVAEFPD